MMLGMMFQGAGSKNYSTEILHFTHNMKKVWDETGFSELVRDNIIINMTGGRDRCEGVDANMEHQIKHMKVCDSISYTFGLISLRQELFAAKGLYGSWDRLADISAAIDVIGSVKKSIAMSLDVSYNGTGHTKKDTSNLVWRIAHKAQELNLNGTDLTRDINSVVKASVNIRTAGRPPSNPLVWTLLTRIGRRC
ncbi:hypothetical protein K438DRAFT_1813697 [Mycena galopus ATCC 62051]|nr:hypothetical protein K438DRAFT_1813697 [Mycena galopus ATCC 62051]